jgi:hypothetical protein
MVTMNGVKGVVKVVPVLATDESRTQTAREAHERALRAIDRCVSACEQLADTGDHKAGREARIVAEAIHRLTDGLFQTLVPHYENGKWLR